MQEGVRGQGVGSLGRGLEEAGVSARGRGFRWRFRWHGWFGGDGEGAGDRRHFMYMGCLAEDGAAVRMESLKFRSDGGG